VRLFEKRYSRQTKDSKRRRLRVEKNVHQDRERPLSKGGKITKKNKLSNVLRMQSLHTGGVMKRPLSGGQTARENGREKNGKRGQKTELLYIWQGGSKGSNLTRDHEEVNIWSDQIISGEEELVSAFFEFRKQK